MSNEIRVLHLPNIPGPAFTVEVKDLATATAISDALAYYDLFLLDNNYRNDYANIAVVQEKDDDDDWFDVDEGELEEFRLDVESIGSE